MFYNVFKYQWCPNQVIISWTISCSSMNIHSLGEISWYILIKKNVAYVNKRAAHIIPSPLTIIWRVMVINNSVLIFLSSFKHFIENIFCLIFIKVIVNYKRPWIINLFSCFCYEFTLYSFTKCIRCDSFSTQLIFAPFFPVSPACKPKFESRKFKPNICVIHFR